MVAREPALDPIRSTFGFALLSLLISYASPAFAGNGRLVVCSSEKKGSFTVAVFDRGSGDLVHVSGIGGEPDTLLVTGGGGHVYLAVRNKDSRSIVIYDIGADNRPKKIASTAFSNDEPLDVRVAQSTDSSRTVFVTSGPAESPSQSMTHAIILDDQGNPVGQKWSHDGFARHLFFDANSHRFGIVIQQKTGKLDGPIRFDYLDASTGEHMAGGSVPGRAVHAGSDSAGDIYLLVQEESGAHRLVTVRDAAAVSTSSLRGESYSLWMWQNREGCWSLEFAKKGRSNLTFWQAGVGRSLSLGPKPEGVSRLGDSMLQVVCKDSVHVVGISPPRQICVFRREEDTGLGTTRRIQAAVIGDDPNIVYYYQEPGGRKAWGGKEPTVYKVDVRSCSKSKLLDVGSAKQRVKEQLKTVPLSMAMSLTYSMNSTGGYYVIVVYFVQDRSGLMALGKGAKYLYAVRPMTNEFTVYNTKNWRMLDNFGIDVTDDSEIRFSSRHRYVSVGKTVIDAKYHQPAEDLPGFGYVSTVMDPRETWMWIFSKKGEVTCLDAKTLSKVGVKALDDFYPRFSVFQ